MGNLGIFSKFINLLRSIYKNAKIAVSNNGDLTAFTEVIKGLMQGEVTSPILFSLFISDLESFLRESGIEGVQVNHIKDILLLAYADDLVFLADSYIGMKKIVKILYLYCERNKLLINVKKTKIMIFKKGGKRVYDKYNFPYGVEKIEIVKSYTYLGIEFFHSGIFDKTSKIMMSRTRLAAGTTLSLINRLENVSWSTSNKLFNALVNSISLYGAQIWSPRYLDRIESEKNSFFKKLLYLPANTPDYGIRLETGNPHISVVIFKLILNWIDKLIRMNENRYPKIAFLRLKELAINFPNSSSKFNWVLQVKEQFFDKIGVNIEKVCERHERSLDDFLIDKYNRLLIGNDIKRMRASRSLYFGVYLRYEITQPQYFNLVKNLNTLRILTQIRLSNKFNERIICRNMVGKPRMNEYCYACCTANNIPHMLIECIYFNDERKRCFEEEFPYILDKSINIESVNANNIVDMVTTIFKKYTNM